MEKDINLAELIEQLPTMDRIGLASLWKDHFGEAPNPKLSLELMKPVLAFRIQAHASGSLFPSARRTIRVMEDASRQELKSLGQSRFRAGTRIVREWNGEIHEVTVSLDGYDYRGETFKSLSPIAKRITGTRWSGPAFFGTRPKERSK